MRDETKDDLVDRRGRFIIPVGMERWPATFMAIMGQCIVVRCECLRMCKEYEYHAFSRQFDVVPANEMTPTYQWTADEAGEEPVVTARRVGP